MLEVFPLIHENFKIFYDFIKNTVILAIPIVEGHHLYFTILDCFIGLFVSSIILFIFGFIGVEDYKGDYFTYSDDYDDFYGLH